MSLACDTSWTSAPQKVYTYILRVFSSCAKIQTIQSALETKVFALLRKEAEVGQTCLPCPSQLPC